jgi:hypothetical protein
MYAAGAALMAAVIAWAYRDLVLRRTNSDQLRQIQILVVLNAIIYGLLIAAVAIDFPSGLIVGLIYLIGYGLGFVGRSDFSPPVESSPTHPPSPLLSQICLVQ